MKWFEMLRERAHEVSERLIEHIVLTLVATCIALLIGIGLAVLARKVQSLRDLILGSASILQTIPSLALLTILLPLFGIGTTPALIALTLYALLPIIRNTYSGLSEVPQDMLQMADALGLSKLQRLAWIEWRFALPFVVAGLRTSTAVSVGVATLSAFIGAGGLGVFINRGLALNNMDLVVLGAIPAGLLAVYLDFGLATLEGFFTPLARTDRLVRRSLAFVVIGCAVFVVLSTWSSKLGSKPITKREVVIGSKDFTEQLVLGQMLAILVEENTDIRVQRRLNLAGTAVCHEAIVKGDIDMYVEYTGTALTNVLKTTEPVSSTEALEVLRKQYSRRFGLEWLPQLGFANTYALAVRADSALRSGWSTISGLKSSANKLTAGFPAEFIERPDGYPGLRTRYGFEFGRVVDMSPTLMYEALDRGQVDVISAFSTDGRILAYGLALLRDDAQFFPPYDAAVVIRTDVLERYPELRPLLTSLSGRLDESTMQGLNLSVDREKLAPKDVARQYLVEQELIREH